MTIHKAMNYMYSNVSNRLTRKSVGLGVMDFKLQFLRKNLSQDG